MPLTSAEDRRAENESAFRVFKALVGSTQAAPESAANTMVICIKCECSDAACGLHIPLSLREYKKIRLDKDAFIVFRDHWVETPNAVLIRR